MENSLGLQKQFANSVCEWDYRHVYRDGAGDVPALFRLFSIFNKTTKPNPGLRPFPWSSPRGCGCILLESAMPTAQLLSPHISGFQPCPGWVLALCSSPQSHSPCALLQPRSPPASSRGSFSLPPAFPGTLHTEKLKAQQVGLWEMLSTCSAASSSRSAPLPASLVGVTLPSLPKPAQRGRWGSSPGVGMLRGQAEDAAAHRGTSRSITR